MERLVKSFKKGNIYCVGARPFIDKTQFCIDVASLFVSKNNKVLYISHEMDKDTFVEKLNPTCSKVGNNINFEEVYKLTIEELKMFASEDNYDLIVLDPFDIYSLDLDVGDLKEFAKKQNVAVLLTTNLARPTFDDDRIHPVLSDMKFVNEKTYKKLITFSELILFLTQEPGINDLKISVVKDIYDDIENKFELN